MRVDPGRFPAFLLCLLLPLLGATAAAAPQESEGEEAVSPVGDETCLGCHEGLEAFRETVHYKLGGEHTCEGCHGPGGRHVEEMDPQYILTFDPAREDEDPRDWDKACLSCHERGAQALWQGGTHQARGLSCTSCHTLMKKVSDRSLLSKAGGPMEVCFGCHLLRKAQVMRSSHMPLREGKMGCLSCHQPHGSAGPSLLKDFSVSENCYRCHAEKRGPFLWEHAPVREKCTNCHNPHGSIYNRLLVRDTPRLCMQCHAVTRHPSTPRDADSKFTFSRACLNCHSAIHGSNHPSGYRFMR